MTNGPEFLKDQETKSCFSLIEKSKKASLGLEGIQGDTTEM